MHTLPLVVMAVILGTLASPAFGQDAFGQEPDGTATGDTTRAAPANTQAQVQAGEDARPDLGSKSGFGQVMALLTGLLEDAAQRETSGSTQGFALDNPAVVVSVTPVQGADSFMRRDGSLPRDDDQRDGDQRYAPRRDTANARLAAQPGHASDATPR